MNVENIKRVRDHIAALPPERFDMSRFASTSATRGRGALERPYVNRQRLLNSCGTCACVAGWSIALLGPPRSKLDDDGLAAELLGLDMDQAVHLFFGWAPGNPAIETTPEQAVRVLDHLLATGEVDWSVADAAAEPRTADAIPG